MNALYQHHKDSIKFHYSCFDRILLHASIQTFQQAKEAAYFFSDWRNLYPVSREDLHDIADQFKNWITNRSLTWEVPILEPPAKRGDDFRRDDFVAPYFQSAKPDQIVAILKAREPATILVSIGKKATGCHLELKWRWVEQYYFYLNDRDFGRMFVGVCPYFPFPAWICLNQHHWLANRMRDSGIRFKQCANAFLSCSDPDQLQLLADSLEARHVIACGQKWLARLIPFFTEKERAHGHCQHRLFFSQVEYCDNLIFRRRFALDRLIERLLDANRTIGHPDKVTIIFGRRVTKQHTGKLQTEIEDLHLGNPVIRACYKKNVAKQYVRDHSLLRTEASTYNVKELRLCKAVDNLPKLQDTLQAITQNYLNVQQDILETFVDRGQMRQLSLPTVTPSGKRIPGLKIDHPRQLALMQALVRFCHIAAQGTFATCDVHSQVAEALGFSTEEYKLGSLRYDLSKLRAKGLVEKLPHARRYRLLPEGYRLCLVYLKLFEKIYAPLTAGLSKPFAGDTRHPPKELSRLDKLYRAVITALDNLVEAVGLKAA